jgi:hypothetical protein
VAHLPGAAQVHPGPPAIHQLHHLAVVEPGVSLQLIELGKAAAFDGVNLTEGKARADDRHGKGSQVVEHDTGQFGLALPAGALEPAVVLLAPFEGSVHEHQLPLPGRLRS